MQSNSENSSVTAAMVAALVTRRPTPNENPAHNSAMRVYLDKLRELVPHCPKNRNVSKLELIQHVIDYINDLQETLQNGSDPDSPPTSPAASPLSFTEAFSHLSFSEDGNLREIKTCSSYEDFPNATSYTSDGSSDYDSRGSSPINNSDTDCSGDECTPAQFSQHYAGPYYTNSLTLQVSSPQPPATLPSSFNTPAPSGNDPRRFFRKGYGLPAHISG